jgi:lantibiotic biosynthesis protein
LSLTDFERVLALHAAVNEVVDEFEPQDRWSLQGLGAKSLLEARLEGLTGDVKWKRSAHDTLAQTFELLSAASFFSIGLHSGVTGIGWVARLVNRRLGWADQFDVSDVDDMVLDYLSSPESWDGDFDILAGATGCAVYAFEHPDRRLRLEMLDAYVSLLSSRAEPDERGVWWKTPASVLEGRQLNGYPSGGFDMGLAHGVPGVAAMLSRMAAAGTDFPDLTRLLGGSVAACRSELRIDPRTDREVIGYFRGDEATARCAWCYGEPGLVVALGAAGKALGDRRLRDKARMLFRSSVSRSDHSTLQVDDICLCHGWTGLYLVSRYLQALVPGESLDPCPMEAQFLLEMRSACDASLAYAQLPLFGPTRPTGPRRDPTFLTGALGVAHALLDSAFLASKGTDLPWADCVLM